MRALGRWFALLALAGLALLAVTAGRIMLLNWVDAPSTAFQRSEAWRLARQGALRWRHAGQPLDRISVHLQRAVIASEDDGFVDHAGIDWAAMERAWERNRRAQERAGRRAAAGTAPARPAKIVGASTITQQLAKNLYFSGERSYARKALELPVVWMLETLIGKQRILTVYLNSVEWGEGVFGAEAAAQHHFGKPAAALGPAEAARLAVMLPAPKRFERLPNSPYLAERSAIIQSRMAGARLP